MKATGIVDAVTKDRKGIKLDDGEWYNTWEDAGFPCERGDSVTFEYKEGKSKTGRMYRNLVGKVNVVGVDRAGPTTSPEAASPFAVKMPRDRAIINQTCIKASSEVVAALIGAGIIKDTYVAGREAIDIARMFADYCSGDDIYRALEEEDTASTSTDVEAEAA